jgi:hypothetical protein
VTEALTGILRAVRRPNVAKNGDRVGCDELSIA